MSVNGSVSLAVCPFNEELPGAYFRIGWVLCKRRWSREEQRRVLFQLKASSGVVP